MLADIRDGLSYSKTTAIPFRDHLFALQTPFLWASLYPIEFDSHKRNRIKWGTPRGPQNSRELTLKLTCVQALRDGGGVDEEATTNSTADIWVELIEGELGLRERKAFKRLQAQTLTSFWNNMKCDLCFSCWTTKYSWLLVVWNVRK